MGYNSINGIIGNIRGKHDSINSVASGALIGLLFKSTGISSFLHNIFLGIMDQGYNLI